MLHSNVYDDRPQEAIVSKEKSTNLINDSLRSVPQNESILAMFKYLLVGVGFGVVFVKAEVISWFRIQEMFHFESIHMYGVIGTAVLVGIISVALITKFQVKSLTGEKIAIPKKKFTRGQVFGGLLFGFGWAMTGACPGPLFAQIGAGAMVTVVTLTSAVLGTWFYGFLRGKFPRSMS